MTIKQKLIGNVSVVLILFAIVAISQYGHLRFIKDKLSYLTENSTPFQIKTIEFQKALQAVSSKGPICFFWIEKNGLGKNV